MKKSTKATVIMLAVMAFYLFLNWVLAGIFGNNIQAALAAFIGTYVLYDISKSKEV